MSVAKATKENYDRFLAANIQVDQSFDGSKKWVWIPEGDDGYAKAELVAEGDNCKVVTTHGDEKTVKQSDIFPANPPKFDGVQDMSELSLLSDATVFHNLKLRFCDNRIHTYSGLFLVVVNPYKPLPIYTEEMMRLYQGRRRDEVAPHVYAIADEAYVSMRDNKRNQSILVTGESGAGKTVNTKKVIAYLATIAGRKGVGQLEEQILQTNPILEAFGNAKTLRNDNSSRFGKFIQVQFTNQGFIAGATIDHYLLEKSRVTRQNANERNYHIFYQLFSGLSPAEKENLKLTDMRNYTYINHSGCYVVDELDDGKEFQATRDAMRVIGIEESDQEGILRIMAAVLHLGNITFGQNNQDEAFVKDRAPLLAVAELLRVNVDGLEFALTKMKLKVTGAATIIRPYNADMAAFARDALARALYDRNFDWLVKRINKAIDHDAKKANFIGVLDIAGFEIFEDNSFEQLCINFTNEKLQQFFNHHMFKLEQEEYDREKIKWDFLDFGLDLQDTIDLIEKPGGMLALLDEECVFPKATDLTFLSKLEGKFAQHKKYEKPRILKGAFTLKHYAGNVTYNVAQWLTKNQNPLSDDTQEVMQASLDAYVQGLFWVDRAAATGRKKGAAFSTVAGNYKGQLMTLLSVLSSTEPHFIRCIKPNPEKRQGSLHAKEVLHQLRCNGVLEGIRIARQGFPNRLVFEDFKKRYTLLASNVRLPADPPKAIEAVLRNVNADPALYQIGRTKVFFKAGFLGWLEERRDVKLSESARIIQRAWRRHYFRQNLKQARMEKRACLIIQRNTKAWVRRKNQQWSKLYRNVKPLLKPNRADEELREKKIQIEQLTVAKTELEAKAAQLGDAIVNYEKQLESSLKDRERLMDSKTNVEKELAETKDSLAFERSSNLSKQQKSESQIADLASKLEREKENNASLDKSKKSLELQLQEVSGQFDEANATKAALEKAKGKLTGDLAGAQARIEQLEAELAELQRAKKKVDSDLEEARGQLNAAQRARAQLEEQLNSARADLEKARADNEKLAQEKKGLENAKKQLEAKLADLSEQLEVGDKTKSQTEEQRKKLSRELQELNDQLANEANERARLDHVRHENESRLEELGGRLARVEAEKQKGDKEKDTLKQEITALKEQLEGELANRANVEKSKKKVESELEEVRGLLDTEARGKAQAEQLRKKLEGDLKSAQAQVEQSIKQRTTLEEQLRQLQGDLDEAGMQLELESKAKSTVDKQRKQLEAKLDELKEVIESKQSLEKGSQMLRREVEILKEQLEEEVDARNRLQTMVADRDAQITELGRRSEGVDKAKVDALNKQHTEEVEALKEKVSEVENQRNSLDAQLRKAKQDFKTLETELQAEREERTSLDKQLKKAIADGKVVQGQADTLTKKLQESDARAKKLQDALNEVQADAEAANKNKAALDKAKRAAEAQLEELRSQVEEAEERRKKAVRELEVQLNAAREDVDAAEDARRSVEQARASQEAELARLKKALEGASDNSKAEEAKRLLQSEIDALRAQLEDAAKARAKSDKDRERLAQEAAQANAATTAANDAKSKAEKERKVLQTRVEEEAAKTARAVADLKKLQADVAAAKAETEEAVQERSKAQKQVRDLQARIAQLQTELEDAEAGGALKGKVKQLEAKVTELQNALNEEQEHARRAESGKKAAEDELADLRDRAEQATASVAAAEKKFKTAQRNAADLEEQLQLAQDKVTAEVNRTKKKLQQEIDDLNANLEKETRAKAQAQKSVRNLQRELDDTKVRLEKFLTGADQ